MKIHFGKIKPKKSRSAMAAIGEGRFRTARILSDNTVEKAHKTEYVKDYGFFQIEFPVKPYIRVKYGVRDLNLLEAKNYNQFFANAPSALEQCFPKVLGIKGEGTKSTLRMELVIDFDGKKSMPLSAHTKIKDTVFWKKYDELITFLSTNKIPLMDLRAENIMVKRIGETESIPAMVDYKCVTGRMYPFQPSTWFLKGALGKMLRRAERIRKQYA
ncbi:Uncharacterised protein [uncultured archaeon]|nr:Uncharacterised protein [uncultured archaeon]